MQKQKEVAAYGKSISRDRLLTLLGSTDYHSECGYLAIVDYNTWWLFSEIFSFNSSWLCHKYGSDILVFYLAD